MRKTGEETVLLRLKGKVWQKRVSWQESNISKKLEDIQVVNLRPRTLSHLLLPSHHPYMFGGQSVNAG